MRRGLHLRFLVLLALAALPPAIAHAQESLWMLSTRRLPSAGEGRPPVFAPAVWRFDAGRGWVASSLDELLRAGCQASATNVFIHGNDTSAQDAAEMGLALYRQLQPHAHRAAPRQFVIWSWPTADLGARVRKSAQVNELRTNTEGYYLACYLSRASPEVPMHITGYCTGARITTGGLHLLGGGTLAGMQIAQQDPAPRRQIHAVLLAACIPNDWLLPGQPHGRAISQVDRLAITVNTVDPVLRWHPLIWGRGGHEALGMTGLPESWRLGPEQGKVVWLDLTLVLERRHGWKYYKSSPQVITLLQSEQQRASVARAESERTRR